MKSLIVPFLFTILFVGAQGIRSARYQRQSADAVQETEFQVDTTSSAFKFDAIPNLSMSQHLISPTENSAVERAMIPIDVFIYGLSQPCPSDVEVTLSYSFSVEGTSTPAMPITAKGRCTQESSMKETQQGPAALFRVVAKTSVPARHRLMRWLGPRIADLSWTVTVSQGGRNAEPLQASQSPGGQSKLPTKNSSMIKFEDLTSIV